MVLDKYQMDILENLRKVNCDYYQVGWYQSTYLNSHFTKDFFESQIPYQSRILESVVIVYGEWSYNSTIRVMIIPLAKEHLISTCSIIYFDHTF